MRRAPARSLACPLFRTRSRERAVQGSAWLASARAGAFGPAPDTGSPEAGKSRIVCRAADNPVGAFRPMSSCGRTLSRSIPMPIRTAHPPTPKSRETFSASIARARGWIGLRTASRYSSDVCTNVCSAVPAAATLLQSFGRKNIFQLPNTGDEKRRAAGIYFWSCTALAPRMKSDAQFVFAACRGKRFPVGAHAARELKP